MDGADKILQPRRSVGLTGMALSWATLIVLVVIWGSAFAALRIAVTTIHPVWTIAGRLGSATLLLAIVLGVSLLRKRGAAIETLTLANTLPFCLVGIAFTAAPFMLYAIAAKTTGSAVMAICNGGTPFVTAVAAHVFLGDKLTTRRLAGVGMGFLGLAVLVWPQAQKGFEGSSLFGILIAIFGAALYAGGNVVTRMAPRLSPLLSSFVIVASGAVAALGCALVLAPFPANASTESIAAVTFLGVLPTGVAMVMYVWLIQRAGAMFVSFSTYLSPLWATVIGVTFMNEDLRWSMAGSLALILSGVAVANMRGGRSAELASR